MSEIKVNSVVNSTGDNDSGLDLSTNDQVIIKTANTTAVTVDASQNVGIGNSSPATALDVTGTVTAGGLTVDGTASTSITSTNGNILNLYRSGTGSDSVALNFYDGSNDRSQIKSADGGLSFHINGTTRAVDIDSSGNLLVGQTSFAYGSVGCSMTSSGQLGGTADGDSSLILNRKTSNGTIAQFRKDNTVVGTIGTSSGFLYAGHDDVGLIFRSNESIRPYNPSTLSERDNQIDLGVGAVRFDDIFATNGTIQTSDRNEKQDIEELSDAEQRVAVVAKGLMRKFRWIDSVAEKGDNARTHFGIIAQDLQDAFTAEGLDAGDYAMFTSDTWWEKEISVDAVEADEENGIEAKDAYTYMDIKEEATEGYTEKTRLGVRYNQLLAFIISAL